MHFFELFFKFCVVLTDENRVDLVVVVVVVEWSESFRQRIFFLTPLSFFCLVYVRRPKFGPEEVNKEGASRKNLISQLFSNSAKKIKSLRHFWTVMFEKLKMFLPDGARTWPNRNFCDLAGIGAWRGGASNLALLRTLVVIIFLRCISINQSRWPPPSCWPPPLLIEGLRNQILGKNHRVLPMDLIENWKSRYVKP